MAECTLKESAAINQILGRKVNKWRRKKLDDCNAEDLEKYSENFSWAAKIKFPTVARPHEGGTGEVLRTGENLNQMSSKKN